MSSIAAAFWAECLKIRKSRLFWLSILAAVFLTGMIGFMMFISRNPEMAAKLGLMGTKSAIVKDADWPYFLGLLNEIIAGAGAIGFGFVTAWVFGREYSDRTVKDLLALPIPRSYIVLSKFLVVAIWCALLALTVIVSGLLIGWLAGLPGWSNEGAVNNIEMFAVVSLLTLLLSTPVAFLASYGRGYLAPIGFVILTLITAQFCTALGLGPYFPWAIPGAYSVSESAAGTQLGVTSYAILIITSLIGLAATFAWWRYADQF